jgi:hypothetical protein
VVISPPSHGGDPGFNSRYLYVDFINATNLSIVIGLKKSHLKKGNCRRTKSINKN